jgi:Lipase (class 3)
MKYATAVYGDAMIRAAELELEDRFDARLLGTPSQDQVRQHCCLKETDDIVSFDIDYDGDVSQCRVAGNLYNSPFEYQSSHLRHMIVVDHSHRNIILSIRGTFSLSEIAVDMAAFSRTFFSCITPTHCFRLTIRIITGPFCDGEAHSEMANTAELVWTKAEPTIRQLKTKHPDYEFVLTGHSLGAGVATLVHMMLQYREKDDTFFQARCMAFAAPPTISRHRPLHRCVNFIHDQDIIPFLSVDSVRRLCKSIQTIDEENMSLLQRWKAIRSPAWTNEKLLKKVRDLPPVSTCDGAPALHSAAETNVWLRRLDTNTTSSWFFDDPNDDDDDFYKVELWNATGLTNVAIRLELTHDHLPSLYEQALTQWSKNDDHSQ